MAMFNFSKNSHNISSTKQFYLCSRYYCCVFQMMEWVHCWALGKLLKLNFSDSVGTYFTLLFQFLTGNNVQMPSLRII